VAGSHIDFNVSHSGEFVALVFSRAGPVGIDIEQERPELASNEVIDRFFSAAERSAVRAQAATDQSRAFFRVWTRQEAAVKTLGLGIADDTFSDGEAPFIWFDLALPSGYYGSLAWLPIAP